MISRRKQQNFCIVFTSIILWSIQLAECWIMRCARQSCVALSSPYQCPMRSPTCRLNVMSTDENDFSGMGYDDDEEEMSDEELAASMGEWDDKIARFNTVFLTGRVGTDPEPRYFDDGKVVVNINLAVTRKYHWMERKELGLKSGEEETDWYGLEIWGQTAEFVAKFVDKGARVGVVGSLQVDEWTDKETGEKRQKAKVIVREFEILETRAEADTRRSSRRGPSFYTEDDYEGPSSAGSGFFFD